MRKKIKVEHRSGYELKDGGWVDYYDVGVWNFELIDGEMDEELWNAKHSIKVFRAWYRYLKKQKRKANSGRK